MLGSAPGTIKAICRGSGRSSYVLKVRWREGPSGVVVDDSCSCPLGGECKHCVAAIITARRSGRSAHGQRPAVDWRRTLAGLAGPDAGDRVETAALALQVGLHRPAGSAWRAQSPPHVTVRPVRRGKTGRWVKTGVSWREIASPHGPTRGHRSAPPIGAAGRAVQQPGGELLPRHRGTRASSCSARTSGTSSNGRSTRASSWSAPRPKTSSSSRPSPRRPASTSPPTSRAPYPGGRVRPRRRAGAARLGERRPAREPAPRALGGRRRPAAPRPARASRCTPPSPGSPPATR